jgi:hypothetical protein
MAVVSYTTIITENLLLGHILVYDLPFRAMIMEENASGKLPPAARRVSPMTESGTPKLLPIQCKNNNYPTDFQISLCHSSVLLMNIIMLLCI